MKAAAQVTDKNGIYLIATGTAASSGRDSEEVGQGPFNHFSIVKHYLSMGTGSFFEQIPSIISIGNGCTGQ
jgi:hypothetical protein